LGVSETEKTVDRVSIMELVRSFLRCFLKNPRILESLSRVLKFIRVFLRRFFIEIFTKLEEDFSTVYQTFFL
jgi:hypothetical protein